jgi:uroporphyrinogen-III synthase
VRDRVLITRPEPGASETAALVAAMGFTPVVAPLLSIRATPVRLPPPDQIVAILMASGNAADRLPAPFRTKPVLTVGATTARRAIAAGFANVTSAEGDAVALAALVQARLDPRDGTLLLAAGQGQSLALVADLRGSGYRVVRRVVYAAMPVTRLPDAARVALLDKRTRAVLFFSAETARQFVRLVRASGLLDTLPDRDAITIGHQAGVALEGVTWSRVRVAGKPTQDEMLALLR